jgi:hypothetical protein
MSGAVGHIYHLHEDDQLTFGELKELVRAASLGSLERVTEKFDGANITFTWLDGSLRVARTQNEIRSGGMNRAGFSTKFKNPVVQRAFCVAFDVLERAISSIQNPTRDELFEDGTIWYSAEIVYSQLSQTINYDNDCIIFHGYPVFTADGGELHQDLYDDKRVQLLSSCIGTMQSAVRESSFKLNSPAMLRMKSLTDGTFANNVISKLDAEICSVGCTDIDTIQEYVRSRAYEDVCKMVDDVDHNAALLVSQYVSGLGVQLVDISSTVSPADYLLLRRYIGDKKQLRKRMIAPVEKILHDFAVELLKGIRSTLIVNAAHEAERLKKELSTAISLVSLHGDGAAKSSLASHLTKLGNVHDAISPIEGIVFVHGGKMYKFTGAFAPMNQIVSMITYGKVKVPEKSVKDEFAMREQITTDQLRSVWPVIVEQLKSIGVRNISPIGSTGKTSVMNDIDIAANYNGERESLYLTLVGLVGKNRVRRSGAALVSYLHETNQKHLYQVDVMLGDVEFIKWSRYSPPEGTSKFKGALRNMLLNTAFQIVTEKRNGHERTRLAVDFETGLHELKQTKLGKTGIILKEWKTTERHIVTSDAIELSHNLFGKGYSINDTMSLELIVMALRNSEKTAHFAPRILNNFFESVKKIPLTSKALGADPIKTLQDLREICLIDEEPE